MVRKGKTSLFERHSNEPARYPLQQPCLNLPTRQTKRLRHPLNIWKYGWVDLGRSTLAPTKELDKKGCAVYLDSSLRTDSDSWDGTGGKAWKIGATVKLKSLATHEQLRNTVAPIFLSPVPSPILSSLILAPAQNLLKFARPSNKGYLYVARDFNIRPGKFK